MGGLAMTFFIIIVAYLLGALIVGIFVFLASDTFTKGERDTLKSFFLVILGWPLAVPFSIGSVIATSLQLLADRRRVKAESEKLWRIWYKQHSREDDDYGIWEDE